MSVSGVAALGFETRAPQTGLTSEPANDQFRVDLADVRKLDVELTIQPLPAAFADKLRDLEEKMFTRVVNTDDQMKRQATYAEVRVNGQVVATLTNDGAAITSNNSPYGRLFGGPDEDGMTGPQLAQYRAEKIAKASGGQIVMTHTALSQPEWSALPPPRFEVDRDALEAYREAKRQAQVDRAHGASTALLALQDGF